MDITPTPTPTPTPLPVYQEQLDTLITNQSELLEGVLTISDNQAVIFNILIVICGILIFFVVAKLLQCASKFFNSLF